MSDDRGGHEELRRGLDRLASHAPGPSERRERTVSRARRRARLGVAAVSAGAVALSVAAVFAVGAVRGLDRGDRPIGPTPTGTVKPQPSNSDEPTVRAEGEIAYWSDRSPPGGEARLMVSEADGTGTHEVGHVSISTSRLSWSPDGQRIVFDHGTGSGQGELAEIDVNTRVQISVFRVEDPQSPAWSPDGTRIAFHTDSGALFTLPANRSSTSATPVRRLGSAHHTGPQRYLVGFHPSWSPDGTRIAFVTRHGDIGIAWLDGSSPPKKIEVPGEATSLDWGPDGVMVAVSNDAEALFLVDPTGDTPPAAAPGDATDVSDPTISADGRFVAFVSGASGRPDLYVLDLRDGSIERITDDARIEFSPDWRPAS
jgi:Tol biopolymer transport system component